MVTLAPESVAARARSQQVPAYRSAAALARGSWLTGHASRNGLEACQHTGGPFLTIGQFDLALLGAMLKLLAGHA